MPKDRQEFIEAHFNGADNPTRKDFEQLTTSAELHYVALNHNWDSGMEVLQWIAESDLCDEATALMIFWRLRNYANLYGIEEISQEIIRRIENNEYREVLKYDPKEDTEIKILRKEKWTIPYEMRKAVKR